MVDGNRNAELVTVMPQSLQIEENQACELNKSPESCTNLFSDYVLPTVGRR